MNGIKEIRIGNVMYRIETDRANDKFYGGVKARTIPKGTDMSDMQEVYIGVDGKLYSKNYSAMDFIHTYENLESFPEIGIDSNLYIDSENNALYRYSTVNGYSKFNQTNDMDIDQQIDLVNGNVE